jgi:lysophospholipase L1-like esterase
MDGFRSCQFYGVDSVYSRDGNTFTWHFTPTQSGTYEVSLWWTQWASRSTTVPVAIEDDSGVTTVTVNQRVNGGQWNSQGQFYFESGTTYDVRVTAQPGPSSTSADAVRFVLVSTNSDPTVIIDNRSTKTSSTGTWSVSGAANFYGVDSVYSRDGNTFTWHFTPTQSGTYEVSLWWTQWASRSTTVPVAIEDDSGVTTVTVNQRVNGGQWNSQGQFYFESGTTYDVRVTAQPGPSSTSADAVRFVLVSTNSDPTVIIDNRSTKTSSTGTWSVSGAANFYGVDSVYSRDGNTFTWHFTPTQSGTYEVSLWWTQWASRSTTVPVAIEDDTGVTTVTVNQRVNGGQWNPQGQFYFESGTTYDVRVTAQPGPSSTSADAVRFVLVSTNSDPTVIIDNHSTKTSSTGTWSVSGAANFYGVDSFYSRDGNTFTWHFSPTDSGFYAVSMWWTVLATRSSDVPVDINHADGLSSVYINQQKNGGKWNVLEVLYFESDTTYDITITAQGSPSSTCADAVRFQRVESEPYVAIVEPLSYHIQTSPDLTAKAIAVNLDPTWKIKFVLDIGTPEELAVFDTSEPYEALFTDVVESEHTIHAIIVDSSDQRVVGVYTQDQVIQVGIGNYYVAIGDSITFGEGDDDPFDDISQDGRNSGGGYEPILNDRLTDMTGGVPHTIVNQGIGGQTSAYGLSTISFFLEAHPESQRFLVQWGTNDARPDLPVPSGLGLSPADDGYPGSFKDNMQQIIDAINAAGKEVCIAKPPITLGNGPNTTPYTDPDAGVRSVLIKEYNEVIDELKNDLSNNIVVTPPDFYSLFNEGVPGGKRYDFEYTDNLHPNGAGYDSMADRWVESLIQ